MPKFQHTKPRECVLLLTAAIKPPKGIQITLTDENDREKQYIESVKFHFHALKSRGLHRRMILAEGSASSSESLQEICADHGCEFFKYEYPVTNRERGKGHREAAMIKEAINALGLTDTLLLKITGRLHVLNICAIINSIENSDASCLTTAHAKTYYADTRVIAFTGRFWNIVSNLSEYIDDDKGQYLEHVVAAAIRIASLAGMPSDYLDPPACIQGSSGTHGMIYRRSKFLMQLNKIKTTIKKKIYPLRLA